MKTSELRIGNLVNYQVGTSVFKDKVTAITEKRIVVGNVAIKHDCLRPIPLTEELLVNFGFLDIYNNNNDIHYIHPLLTHCHIEYEDSETTDEKFLTLYFHSGCYNVNCSQYNGYDVRLFSVHQLQNLYFALTEEELTIKK